MQLSYRLVSFGLVAASTVGVLFALYLQHVQGLAPCPLCVFQRIGLIAMGAFALIALLTAPVLPRLKRLWSGLMLVSIGWSTAVAGRHVWLQHLPPDEVPSCGPGLSYWLDALPLQAVIKNVLQGSGECAKIDWTFLGWSLPMWSLLFFSGLLLVCLWQLLRRYP